jgi:hypothetical protein
MSRIPLVAGVIGEHEFFKIVVVGSDGVLVPRRDDPDIEDIDFFLHPGDAPEPELYIQVKNSWELLPDGRLHINVDCKVERIFTHPRFWYFFAHFDAAHLAFRDPLFLVPSAVLHALPSIARARGRVGFNFEASMKPDSRDRWVEYRTTVRDIARRFESIFTSLPVESPGERLAWKRFMERPAAA